MAEEEKSKRKWAKNVNKPDDTHEPDMEPYSAANKPEQANGNKTRDYQKALASPKAIRNGFYGTKD